MQPNAVFEAKSQHDSYYDDDPKPKHSQYSCSLCAVQTLRNGILRKRVSFATYCENIVVSKNPVFSSQDL